VNGKAAVLLESLAYFLGGAVVLFAAVHYAIPYLHVRCGIAPLLGWWLTSGALLTALFVAAVVSARHVTGKLSVRRILSALNLRPVTVADALWALGGLIGVAVLTALVTTLFSSLFSINLLSQDSYSAFLRMEKLRPNEYWLFAVWLPYFFFNIFGEELLWRGYLLPRQVGLMGRYAWVLNAALWAIFHVGIGWRIAVVLLPIECIVPYIVQRRGNTWLGIIIHGLYNGTGFILVALGAVS
jgi:membrane protease YdiL (CAAX protease family)